MKSTAKKTECADEHTEQSGDAVIEGKDSVPETPEEQTMSFQAINAGDDDLRHAGDPATGHTDTAADDDATSSGDATGGDGATNSGAAGFDVFAPVKAQAAEVATGDTGTTDAAPDRPGFNAFAPIKAQTTEVATGDAGAYGAASPETEAHQHSSTTEEAADVSSDAGNASSTREDIWAATEAVSTEAASTKAEDFPPTQDVSTETQDVSSAQDTPSAKENLVSSPPEDVPTKTRDVWSTPETVSADPPDVLPVQEDVSAAPEDVSAGPEDVSVDPEDVSAGPEDVSPVPQDVPVDREDVLPEPEGVSFDPFKETQPQSANGEPQSSPGDPGSRGGWEPAGSEQAADADGSSDSLDSDDGEEGEEGFQTSEHVREVPLPKPVSRQLTAALSGLKDSVTGLRLGLDVPGVEEARKAQVEILAQIEDYVIPRVHMSTAPALIAVVGSTGAGKSTLVNTLAAAKVSATGVRRPTTGTPVLACHPDDRDWFAKGDVLGGMIRVDRPTPDGSLDTLVLASTERLPQGVALLDTPDIDSVVETHHEVAHRMLDAADLWVFVTTATRYADAPAWNLLRLAKERGARLAIVLSRVPVRSREVIDKHFSRMLQEYGLGDVERFVINESTVTAGRLPEEEVAELRMWLTELSVDDQRRSQAVQVTLDGVLNSFRSRVPALARHLEAQVAFRAELRTDVDAAYMGALAEIDEATTDGSLLRGEVLARWQDFAGSGDLMKTLHLRRPGRMGTKTSQQAPARLRAFKTALRSGLESVIVSAGQRAAEEVVVRWRQRDGVGDRLAAAPGLGCPSDEFVRRVGRTIGAWQEHVVALIHSGGVAKRSVAKLVAFDEESLSLVFMIGLLGYGSSDVAASSGTGTLPERLLRGVLGAESLRAIGTRARSDLRARISVLFDEETLRYVQVLDEAGIPDEAAAKRLYQATYNLEVAR
ncbi:GTPase [Sphaerisporangium sp. NPDC088356]|uniref:GTPase n=1 Tax=Sphaerisporangium sp. NPDC088356 TaxID=3154871 RepID=UPI003435D2C1